MYIKILISIRNYFIVIYYFFDLLNYIILRFFKFDVIFVLNYVLRKSICIVLDIYFINTRVNI